jgi:hypothetical protein
LQPGEEKTVVFRLDVDSDATPKDYGINSEIKYADVNGDTVISEICTGRSKRRPEQRLFLQVSGEMNDVVKSTVSSNMNLSENLSLVKRIVINMVRADARSRKPVDQSDDLTR